MKKGPLITIALVGFLLGVVLIVFLQVVSGNNINRLIQGNNKLLTELQIQRDLHAIESGMLGFESDIRGAVISGNNRFLPQIEAEIVSTGKNVETLSRSLHTANSNDEVKELNQLVSEKIRFSRRILQAYRTGGKTEAEAIINTFRGKELRDSIMLVLDHMHQSHRAETATITRQFERSGQQARTWGFVLAVIACSLVVIAFWYIVNQSQQQQRIIRSLNESERKIKEAAQMKEQFMANMSHEIRTPMNAIIGFTNLLRRTQLEPTQREYVQNIHSAGDNLLALINDILDLSKIEAGMMQLEETRFSIRSLTASVGAMFAEKVAEKRLEYASHVAADVPDILSGDAVRLTQVLVNLIGNAVKFTPGGIIELRVERRYETPTMVGLRILVTDTGIGIETEKLHSIFDRFQQAEADTTRRYGGTGLGLSIVRQLVELQGGSIDVQSQEGQGSVFTVNIDYRIPDLSEVSSASVMQEVAVIEPGSIQVLVAEDNNMNQQLIRHLMRNWGFGCTIVANGAEAVAELKKKSYLLVLMDIQMPEMDGYITTSVIRNELKLDIPIIAMTAHAMMGEKEKCLQLGMNDYLSKPIRENDLYNLIAQYAQLQVRSEAEQGRAFAGNNHLEYVNLEYLHQLSGNDPKFEREMMEQFMIQARAELTALDAAFAGADLLQVRSIAHSLKSTMGYMGLTDLVGPDLSAIEKAGKEGDVAAIPAPLSRVRELADKTLIEVSELLLQGEKGD
ncbi:Signal transduction histidine kinase [Cnuella takakiae]|uniref:Sensory/regulatory protein RpfC n=1 Tax=Cnuella takakiae TaxID=1302690 RepID=A0A1M4XBL2_9BACT|nr:ATP-binding protein [Cnuella takakiae]OLY91475.1 hypothetical protein BUE76_05840 [Cnuella takakiae]SHE90833.1 Signal transduction histidine kinase [Cnuella takakiae]